MGCSLGCNMLFRFAYTAELSDEPVKVVLEAKEIYPNPINSGKSDLPLILGLTFGGIIFMLIGAWFYVRYQRRKK